MVRPDRSRARSDHDKRHSAVRIPVPPAALRCPNPRPVARSGPRTVSGRADTPRLAAPDPFVPRLSGRCPARAKASRRQARSTIESVGASSYGVPVRSRSILAHRTRRFQPTSPNDAVVLESTVALTSTRKHCYSEAGRILSSQTEGGHSFRTLGQNLKRMVMRLLDCVEHPLDLADRYHLVKQVGHRVHEVDRRFTAHQWLGQAPRNSLSRWTP
jgi:hypothetical protein